MELMEYLLHEWLQRKGYTSNETWPIKSFLKSFMIVAQHIWETYKTIHNYWQVNHTYTQLIWLCQNHRISGYFFLSISEATHALFIILTVPCKHLEGKSGTSEAMMLVAKLKCGRHTRSSQKHFKATSAKLCKNRYLWHDKDNGSPNQRRLGTRFICTIIFLDRWPV